MRTATKQEAINGNSNDTVITPLRLKQVLANADINPGGGGGSSDAPVYTAGTGISIINNVISNTINKTSQLTNDSNFITEEDLPDININDPVPINSIFAYEGDTVPDGFIEYTGEIGGEGGGTSFEETDPTVPDYVKAITPEDIEKWNTGVDLTDYAKKNEIPKNLSQLENDSGFINAIPEDVLRKDTDVRVSNVVSKNLYNKDNIYRTGASNQNVVNDISLKPNTSYYFKTGKTWTEVKLYDSEGGLTRSLGGSEDTTEIQFNTSSNEVKGQFIFYVGNYVEIKDFTGIQLEENVIASDYVPYLNLLETILKYTELKDTELRLSNVVSRNLFNSWKYNYENDVRGCSHSINNTNKITFNVEADWARKKVIFKLKPNTTYTISSDITNNNGYHCGFWNNSSKPLSTANAFKSKLTFTTDDNGEFGVWFYCNFSDNKTVGQVVFDNIQLEENAIATDYVPYLNLEEAMNKDEIYSTSEQRIGTWIDGKPLYRKTIVLTSGWNNGSETVITHGISNFKRITDARVSATRGDGSGQVFPNSFAEAYKLDVFDFTSNDFKIWVGTGFVDWYALTEIDVTLEYTKTTD